MRGWSAQKGAGSRRSINIPDLFDLLSAVDELNGGAMSMDNIADNVVIVGRTARLVDVVEGTEQNVCTIDEVPLERMPAFCTSMRSVHFAKPCRDIKSPRRWRSCPTRNGHAPH